MLPWEVLPFPVVVPVEAQVVVEDDQEDQEDVHFGVQFEVYCLHLSKIGECYPFDQVCVSQRMQSQ